jgi:uncharacterized membrane protein
MFLAVGGDYCSPRGARSGNLVGAREQTEVAMAAQPEVPSGEPQPFHAVLHPHRSLGGSGFAVLMGVLTIVSVALGTVFVMVGAWPVFGFFGLDVILVYVAFRLSYRSGRLFETVDLAKGRLDIARVHPCGRREVWSLIAHWVRVEVKREESGACDLALASHGTRLSLARFLSAPEKIEFADALARALAPYRAR